MTETTSGRVLIVDDESSIRESLTEFLCDYNIMATAAACAEEGLDLLDHASFDLAIVDIRLPGINGDQFIVKAHQVSADMKFIIHTGSVHFRINPELKKIGLTLEDVFLKPIFDLDQLLAHALKLLDLEVNR